MQAEIDRRARGYSAYANDHKPCLVQAMREWFGEIHAKHTAHAYDYFASKIVQPGDTVVTFDYDVALESSLRHSGKWCVGDGYGFSALGLPAGSTVNVLKLHGTINWSAVMFGGLTGTFQVQPGRSLSSRPAFSPADLAALGYSGVSDSLFPSRSALLPTMIFPTSRKQFFFQTNLGREWEPLWRRYGAERERQCAQADALSCAVTACIPLTGAAAICC